MNINYLMVTVYIQTDSLHVAKIHSISISDEQLILYPSTLSGVNAALHDRKPRIRPAAAVRMHFELDEIIDIPVYSHKSGVLSE